jgi:hypothetical protein
MMTRSIGRIESGREAQSTGPTTVDITLTGAECQYLVLEMSVDELWPNSTREHTGYPVAGGPQFRLQFIRLVDSDLDERFTFRFTESELWLLDALLLPRLRTGKLPDGTPVDEFARKVWTGLMTLRSPRLDALLNDWHAVVRKGTDHADNEDSNAVPYPRSAGRAPHDGSQRGA